MPQRFGRFWLHEKIGHGGMAEIFRATIGPDPDTFAFEMALKRMHPHLAKDPAQVDMFFTEADIGKLLRHPNIVQVYESGLIEGQAYIAMEFVWGYDLATLIELLRKRRLRFPSDLAIFTVLQVLKSLDYVHRAMTPAGEPMNIVHRDVTPSNIYVTFEGEVKLGDFGIAHVSFLEGGDDKHVLKGKVAYMPPEILVGHEVDQRVDLWSLAVTLYEMLTARRMYEGISEADLMAGRAPPRIESVREVNQDISPALSQLVSRALSPKPKKRPEDAMAFYRQLKQYMRAEGIQVDATALARFVGAMTGARPAKIESHHRPPQTGIFEQPAFLVPLGDSPTRRIELQARRRRWLMPATVLVALAGGIALAVLMLRHPVVVVPSPPAVVNVEPEIDDQAVERSRPAIPDELAIEFSDDLGEDAVDPNPTPAARFRALLHRGRVAVQRKRFAQAEAAFGEAVEMRPRDVGALLGRANALLELKRYKEAEGAVRSAVNAAPKEARAYLLLGDVLWVRGKDREAKAAYQRCIEVEPSGKPAQVAKRILANL